MSNRESALPSIIQAQTVFQKASSEVLAQRIEALALELRSAEASAAGAMASNETLSVLAGTLRMILKKIDEIFEFEGFVFTPSCVIMLELFQARARGTVHSITALCQTLGCSHSVGRRWVDVLESWQLVEKLNASSDDPKVLLSEKGYLRTAQALQLLL